MKLSRAAFYVERARQERQQKIVQAEGEATAAKKLGEAVSLNPGYLKLRKIRAAQSIARTVSWRNENSWNIIFIFKIPFQLAQSNNRVYLNANNLMLDAVRDSAFDDDLMKMVQSKSKK